MKITKPRTFDSMTAAAAGMGLALGVIRAAKAGGCTAFRSNRIYEADLAAWLADHPEILKRRGEGDLKGQKTREEIRKLKLANDLKEGRLIERAWMAARVHEAAGLIDTYRLKSEAEHPTRFDNVPVAREMVRDIWDEIARALNGMKEAFKPKAGKAPRA